MSNTLQSLFPYTKNNAKDFTVYPCYVEFSAPLVAGKYVFSEATTPAVNFGKLLQGQKGIIAGVIVSANCSEDEFSAAVEKPLLLQVLHAENGTPVNMAPFPFAQFSQVAIFQEQWEITGATMLQEEAVKLAVTGEVDQIPGMGANELTLKVVFNFIRVGKDKLQG